MRRWRAVLLGLFFALAPFIAQGAEMGKFQYEDFKNPKRCKTCHKEIYQEWQQSLMSQSFRRDQPQTSVSPLDNLTTPTFFWEVM